MPLCHIWQLRLSGCAPIRARRSSDCRRSNWALDSVRTASYTEPLAGVIPGRGSDADQALPALPANKRPPTAKAVHSRQNRWWFEVSVIVDFPSLCGQARVPLPFEATERSQNQNKNAVTKRTRTARLHRLMLIVLSSGWEKCEILPKYGFGIFCPNFLDWVNRIKRQTSRPLAMPWLICPGM